jgi:hypothetical protein
MVERVQHDVKARLASVALAEKIRLRQASDVSALLPL